MEAKAAGVRLLHTSDWHLGARFFGRSLISDQAYVLDQMINLVRDLNPDVLVVSGDVFHQRRPNEEALALFHDTVGRMLDLGKEMIVLAGPTDDLENLHLNARWVRNQGLYLFQEANQVLSPLSLRGKRDSFGVNAWCLPYPGVQSEGMEGNGHPALVAHRLVETVIQRIDPGAINVFMGYVWAQGIGKRPEFGSLITTGGQPVEKRLLEHFDYSALGGCHVPSSLGPATIRYSGGLLADDIDAGVVERSVTLVEIDGKSRITVDEYPLRSRRTFRVLSGSVEELVEQGRQVGTQDLVILRSQETELTPAQKAQLRSLGSNIVSIETEAPSAKSTEDITGANLSPVLQMFSEFYREVEGAELSEAALVALKAIEEKM